MNATLEKTATQFIINAPLLDDLLAGAARAGLCITITSYSGRIVAACNGYVNRA